MIGAFAMVEQPNPCHMTSGRLHQGDSGSQGKVMASQEPLSRSGMTTRAGIPNDVMTFWVRRGLVRPIYAPSGMGRHLRFEWYEANIAAVMSQLRQFGVPIDGLLSIAGTYRDAIAWASSYELTRDDVAALHSLVILHAHHKHGTYDDAELDHMIGQFSREKPHGKSRITDRIKAIHADMPEDEFRRHMDPFLSITEQPKPGDPGVGSAHTGELTYLWRTAAGDYRFAWGEKGPQLAQEDGAHAMIAVDVSAVLFEVWNRPEGEEE